MRRIAEYGVSVFGLVILAACSPSPVERGCERFAQLVDDVALSGHQPQRLLEDVSGEVLVSQLNNPRFEKRPGESESERSTRLVYSQNASTLVFTLESMAHRHFHAEPTDSDFRMRETAYGLWKSAAVQASGAPGWTEFDTRMEALELAEECGERGYPTPEADPRVIGEYLETANLNERKLHRYMEELAQKEE